MNKGELKVDVADYLKDTSLSPSRLDSFVDKATIRLGHLLQVAENETVETITISTSAGYAMPTGFVRFRSVYSKADRGPIALQAVGGDRFTRFGSQGQPAVYHVAGNQLMVRPFVAGDFEIDWFGAPATLTDDGSTNAVLNAYPHLYLQACLVEGYLFQQDVELAQQYISLLTGEADIVNANAQAARIGHAPTIEAM